MKKSLVVAFGICLVSSIVCYLVLGLFLHGETLFALAALPFTAVSHVVEVIDKYTGRELPESSRPWYSRYLMRIYKAFDGVEEVDPYPPPVISYCVESATDTDINWIAQLEADVYSGTDVIPKETLTEWYSSNPTGFFVIGEEGGRRVGRVGHIDILPLRPRTLQRLIEGTIIEREIRGDSLYSPKERDSIQDLYIESMAICLSERYLRGLAAQCVLSNLISMINKIGKIENIDSVFAIAASESGERFMKSLGFDIHTRADNRKDKHNLYSVKFVNLVNNIIKRHRVQLNDKQLVEHLLM